MTMGGVGISLAGFAGLFSVLGGQDDAPAVYRWRLRHIVLTAFELTFLAFGTVVLFRLTDDIPLTARVISGIAATLYVVGVVQAKPGPAWPDERDRIWARRATLFWAALMAGNLIAGEEPYLQAVMLIFLLSPVLVFIRAVIDRTPIDTA